MQNVQSKVVLITGASRGIKATAELAGQLRTMSPDLESVTNAMLYAISQPDNVETSEIVIRSVSSSGHVF